MKDNNRFYRGSGSDENEKRSRLGSFSNPELINTNSNNQAANLNNTLVLAEQLSQIDMTIQYNRRILAESEDGEIIYEEDEIITLSPELVQDIKSSSIAKLERNVSMNVFDVQLKIDVLTKAIEDLVKPNYQIQKMHYQSVKNGKKVFVEAQVNKMPPSLINLTASEVQQMQIQQNDSSLIESSENNANQNPEVLQARYQLNILLRVTLSEQIQNSNDPQQEQSPRESIDTASFHQEMSQSHQLPEEQILQTVPSSYQKDNTQPLQRISPQSDVSCVQQVSETPQAPDDSSCNIQPRNISIEARMSRLENLMLSFAQNIFTELKQVNQNNPQVANAVQQDNQNVMNTPSHEYDNDQDDQNNEDQLLERDDTYFYGSNSFQALTPRKTNNNQGSSKDPKSTLLRHSVSSLSQQIIEDQKVSSKMTPGTLQQSKLNGSQQIKRYQQQQLDEGPVEFSNLIQPEVQLALQHHQSVNLPQEKFLFTSNINRISQSKLNNEEQQVSSNIDLIFLSSSPLLRPPQKNSNYVKEVFDFPLNIKKEIEELCKAVDKTKKKFVLKSQIGTSTSLTEALIKGTKVLHISCHGNYKSDSETALVFEPSQHDFHLEYGMGFEVKPLDIFNASQYLHQGIKLVFISACHSESVGRLFKQIGIPLVIAVDQSTKIFDDVCIVFSSYFYENLLHGCTPRQAFNLANNLVRTANMDLFFCCCKHNHIVNCPWYQGSLSTNKEDPHQIHEKYKKTCNCDRMKIAQQKKGSERHLTHEQGCQYTINHAQKMIDLNQRYNNKDKEQEQIIKNKEESKFYYACCCQTPEQPHDECSKFKFVTVDDVKNNIKPEQYIKFKQIEEEQMDLPIYKNQVGKLNWVEGNYQTKDYLNQSYQNINNFIGRSIVIQQIVNFIAKNEQNKRLIHIYGDDGNGKSDIANFAARYALEGRVNEIYSAHHIKIENIMTHEQLRNAIFKEIAKQHAHNNSTSLDQFGVEHRYKVNKYLIIIDKCHSFIKSDKNKFSDALSNELKYANTTIFIVISDSKNDLNKSILPNYNEVSIEQLSCRDAFKFFMSSIENQKVVSAFENQIKNEKNLNKVDQFIPENHKFFTNPNFKRNNEEIQKHAIKVNQKTSLKENLDYFESKRENKNNNLKIKDLTNYEDTNKIQEYFFKIFQIYPYKTHRNQYVLLFLISLSQGGLFQSDLDEIFLKTHTGLEWKDFMMFLGCHEYITSALKPYEYNEIALKMPSIEGSVNNLNIKNLDFKMPKSLILSIEQSFESSSDILQVQNFCKDSFIEILVIPSRYLKKSMNHLLIDFFKFKPQEVANIYEYFLDYMINLSRKMIKTDKMLRHYQIEELNVFVNSDFLWRGQDLQILAIKRLSQHEGCNYECLNSIDEEEKTKVKDSYNYLKFNQYESNPQSILQIQFLKNFFYAPQNEQDIDKKTKFPLPIEKIYQYAFISLSLLVQNEKFESAQLLLKNCIEIADYFKLNEFLAKLYLFEVSVNLISRNKASLAPKQQDLNNCLDNVSNIWIKLLGLQDENQDNEEEKNDGDRLNFALQQHQNQDSDLYIHIQQGQVILKLFRILNEFYSSQQNQIQVSLQKIYETHEHDYSKLINRLQDEINILEQSENMNTLLINKLRLAKAEIIFESIKQNSKRQDSSLNNKLKHAIAQVDCQFLLDSGFDCLFAQSQKLKGYFSINLYKSNLDQHRSIDQEKNKQLKIECLPELVKANEFLTQAVKIYKQQYIKCHDLELALAQNFKILKDNRKTLQQSLICCLYSMPLVKNKDAISELYEQDIDRYLKLQIKIRSLVESQQILEDLKFEPLKFETLNTLKNTKQCSILHIFTKCIDPQYLFIEGNEGQGIQQSQEQLLELLINSRSQNKDISHIKFVALAFPGSLQLGHSVFFDNGVEHVMSFDQIAPQIDPAQAFEQIDTFFGIFYEYLLSTEDPLTVVEAYHKTLATMREHVMNVDPAFIPQLVSKKQDNPFATLFSRVPIINDEFKLREISSNEQQAMASSLLVRRSLPKIYGRNFQIHEVVDFILRQQSPQERMERVLRIVGRKNVGKRSVVEAAIHYINFRHPKKVDSHTIPIKPSFSSDEFVTSFNMVTKSFKLGSGGKIDVIVVYDFSDLRSEPMGQANSRHKKAGRKIVTSNELGDFFDRRLETQQQLKIILLQSQIEHDFMKSSSKLINIEDEK